LLADDDGDQDDLLADNDDGQESEPEDSDDKQDNLAAVRSSAQNDEAAESSSGQDDEADESDGGGDSGKQSSGYDTIDLTQVTDGWTLEIDGQGQELSSGDSASDYADSEDFSGTITFDDGSTIVFENIEKVDW